MAAWPRYFHNWDSAPAKNLCTNPSLETNTTGYSVDFVGTGITVGTLSRSNAIATHSGAHYGFVNVTGDGTTNPNSSDFDIAFPTFPVTPGKTYSLLTHIRHQVSGLNISWAVEWKDSNGATISIGIGDYTPVETAVWGRKENLVVAPSRAVTARCLLYAYDVTDTVSRSFRWDATLFRDFPSDGGAYFDGDSSGAVWDGTKHGSTSTLDRRQLGQFL